LFESRVRTSAKRIRRGATAGRHLVGLCIASEFDGRERHAKCAEFSNATAHERSSSSPTQGGDYRKPRIAVNANQPPDSRTRRTLHAF
jgi:hypothetical protein